jgi:hypothetical protein
MPRIIKNIMAVHPTAANKRVALVTPVATRRIAMTIMGMQQTIIIQP